MLLVFIPISFPSYFFHSILGCAIAESLFIDYLSFVIANIVSNCDPFRFVRRVLYLRSFYFFVFLDYSHFRYVFNIPTELQFEQLHLGVLNIATSRVKFGDVEGW